jgi:CheY-like chemotaxis protein
MSRPDGAILVVDDDEGVREAMRALLESEGYAVATASDGAEAIERLRAEDVRLVLLDLAMPGVDGWQFLARRESEAGFPRVPVVLLSGLPFIRDAPGVADFIRKPIDSDTLLDCVRRLCGGPASRPAK